MTLCTAGHAERADDCPACAALCDAQEQELWSAALDRDQWTDDASTPNPGEPMYVYVRSEPGLFTVGYYTPRGEWVSESDHASSEAAARRVAWLNGNRAPTYTCWKCGKGSWERGGRPICGFCGAKAKAAPTLEPEPMEMP